MNRSPILSLHAVLATLFLTIQFSTVTFAAPANPVAFAILHTNDFHGQLQASGSNPGLARTAAVIDSVRTALGDDRVLVVDAGDEMQGSLLSNIGDGTPFGKGSPTIAAFNAVGYDVATFGNHEFDWGQTNLTNRTAQSGYPWVTANIVTNDTGNCATAGWNLPPFADAPYQILTVGTAPNAVKVAFIGVTTPETPFITIATATAGLCFKDPAESIIRHYGAIKAAGADVIVVLSHLGYPDGGYGYGFSVYGDQTLATRLNTAGKPVNLIIGGHSHTDLAAATVVGSTPVVQAHYNGRKVGRADVSVAPDGAVSVTWSRLTVSTTGAVSPAVDAVITSYASDPSYQALINQPIGYTAVDLQRSMTADNMMGSFIGDAIYKQFNSDGETANDVDIFFNNAGGLRTDLCFANPCVTGLRAPSLITYGQMFTVLPFGNAAVVGEMTGAKILEVLNYAPLANGVIQPAGLKYRYFSYRNPTSPPTIPETWQSPWAWGAYDVTVRNRNTGEYEPLDLKRTYRVGTNEFLAPAGGDGFSGFKYMTGITYWGDMLNLVNSHISATHGTEKGAYRGPNGDGTLDGRIGLNGNGDYAYNPGGTEIVPLTILHHNDSHGNAAKGSFVGYTQLATLIKQERARNPERTLLLHAGDAIQGDLMMYYFRTAPTGFAADGTSLTPELQYNPLIKAFNSMGYDAMTLGNHEFDFGRDVFRSVLSQAEFPLLQANIADSGAYGLIFPNTRQVLPHVSKTVGPEGLRVAILGIGNHRVPSYQLPSNIPGLTFSDPIQKAGELAPELRQTHDVVIALSHIGFTEYTQSTEVDNRVDTAMAATVSGLDAVIGGHSHTNPASGQGAYKYLPTIIPGPGSRPVVTSQAYRYNNTLGQVILGLRYRPGQNYEVVSASGRYLSVPTATAEDPDTKAIIDPFVTRLNSYLATAVGQTTVPIDTLQAYTRETNGANLEADAAVHELKTRGIPVDLHLSGATSNRLTAAGATPAAPVSLTVTDLRNAIPYDNSLVVLSLNGPRLKALLERSYRNYHYYKYVPGYGGYSYYTNCMLVPDSAGRISYRDYYPLAPNGNNVESLTINGSPVDFNDPTRYYRISTTSYLAGGACNFNDSGISLWPHDRIEADTQYYVRDAVMGLIASRGSVSPAVEGRLSFIPYYTVSGTLGTLGAGGTVAYDGGSTVADGNGAYSFFVPEEWSGFVTPSKSGVRFTPALRYYSHVTADQTGQDFTGVRIWDLSVTLRGSGTGTVTSDPDGISCLSGLTGGCDFTFVEGTKVTLVPTTAWDSLFAGWSGACTGTGKCTVTMNRNLQAVGRFDPRPAVQLIDGSITLHPNLQDAYDSATGPAVTIRARQFTFLESPIFDSDRIVRLEGGYDSEFLLRVGQTVIDTGGWPVTISRGRLMPRNLAIR